MPHQAVRTRPQPIASWRSRAQGDALMIALPRSLATLVVALTLIAGCPITAGAARHHVAPPPAPKSHILTVPELVNACAALARNYEPRFDAYWDESVPQAHLYGVPDGAGLTGL